MTNKKQKISFAIFALLLCVIVVSFVVLLPKNKVHTSQAEQTAQPTPLPANSPEGVTQAYYDWYTSCVKQHPQDLNNATSLKKDCPMHGYTGMSNNFVNENDLHYTDQVLCDEGIPKKMVIGKGYIGADHTALVDITTIFSGFHYVIPVALRKENGVWKIFRIDCDLDGHID